MSKVNLDFTGTFRARRAICERNGLRLKVDSSVDGPYTTPDGTVYVPPPSPYATKEEAIQGSYVLRHEVHHHMHPDSFEWQKRTGIRTNSLYGYLHNLFDDQRVDFTDISKYLGEFEILDKGRALFLDGCLKQAKDVPFNNRNDVLSRTAFAVDTAGRGEYLPHVAPQVVQFYNALNDEGKELYRKCIEAGLHKELCQNETAEDVENSVKKFLEIAEEKPEEEKEKAQESGKGESGEGEGEGSSADGSGSSEEGGDEEGEPTSADEIVTIKYSDMLPGNEHDGSERAHVHTEGIHIEYDVIPKDGSLVPGTVTSYKRNDLDSDDYWSEEFNDGMREISLSPSFANRLRRLLLVMTQHRWEHGHKRGKISPSNLHRVISPTDSDYRERVFRKKTSNRELDVAISILCDCSGSMVMGKYAIMVRALQLFNRALKVLSIPYEIIGFTESRKGPEHLIAKEFDEGVSEENIQEGFKRFLKKASNNSDGESIAWTYARLKARQEKRKILIVLSDGSPASWRDGAFAFTEKVINSIQADKHVEIYGIGICDSNVKRFYKDNRVINRAEELESAILEVVKDKLF